MARFIVRSVVLWLLLTAPTFAQSPQRELTKDQRKELTSKLQALGRESQRAAAQGRARKALELQQQVLAGYLKVYPPNEYPLGHPELATHLSIIGLMYRDVGDFVQAETQMRAALDMRRRLFPADRYPDGHVTIARSLNGLGLLHERQGDHVNAERYYREALAMRRLLYPKERFPMGHADLAQSLNNLGKLLDAKEDFAAAETVLSEALAMNRRLYPVDLYPDGHRELSISLASMGLLFRSKKEDARAEPFLRETLAMVRKLYPAARFPNGHPEIAVSLSRLATLLEATLEFPEAEQLYREAVAMLRRLQAADRPDEANVKLASTLSSLASLLWEQAKYRDAETHAEEALAEYRKLYPPKTHPKGHDRIANGLVVLGNVASAQGKHRLGEVHLRAALAIRQQLYPAATYPRGHADLAISLNSLGRLLEELGDYTQAEALVRQALEMRRALYPADKHPAGHASLATSLSTLGSMLALRGEFGQAEQLLREALDMRRRLYPSDRYPDGHPELARSLNNLGHFHQERGDHARAEPYYREALALRRKLYPPKRFPQGHAELARSIGNYGNVLESLRDQRQAETHYREALAMRRNLYSADRYPKGHPELASILNNLGYLCRSQGNLDEAEKLYRAAHEMRQALFPMERYPYGHPDLVLGHGNLGYLHLIQGKNADAEVHYADGLAVEQAQLSLFAHERAEVELLNFVARVPSLRSGLLTATTGRDDHADSIYARLWRGKGAVAQILQRRQQTLTRTADRDTQQLAEELREVRQRLSAALLSVDGSAADDLKGLCLHKEDLERRLAKRLPTLQRHRELDGLGPEDLSARLPSESVFLDIYRYSGVSGSKASGPRLAVFILVKGQKVRRIDLSQADQIEEACAAWRQAIVSGQGERTAAATVRRLLWEPLVPVLPNGVRTIYVAPEGALTQLPWCALPGPTSGSLLLERHNFIIAPHATFLLDQLTPDPWRQPAPPSLLAMGGVNYERAQAEAPMAAALGSTRAPAMTVGKRLHWPSLPGTARELEQVTGLAKSSLGIEPRMLLGAAATADEVLRGLRTARFAHLATHGFFADASFRSVLQLDEKRFRLDYDSYRGAAGARNPLVLSGLVTAGANGWDDAARHRGFVTAEAIAHQPLGGMQLAVLSACDTGLGQTAGGEGVFGLQRAFHLAGCPNVVASLWKVNDAAAAAFMTKFYHELWVHKKPPIEALREAQLTVYRHPELIPDLAGERGALRLRDAVAVKIAPSAKRQATADTKLWAAFVLSGVGM